MTCFVSCPAWPPHPVRSPAAQRACRRLRRPALIAFRPCQGDLNHSKLAWLGFRQRPNDGPPRTSKYRQNQLNRNRRSANVASPPTILVFDSGLGGLTVLREIVGSRPDARYVYVADDAFFPYGHHGEDQIIARVVPLIGELISRHAPDLVVIACNTASTLVMSHLRERYEVPFVGTVPAIKPACATSKTKRVSVLGTKGTAKREYTKALIRDFAQGCEVTLVGSAELASLAEAALSGVQVDDRDISAELAPCFVGNDKDHSGRTDTVVLACTHYPLLMDRLIKLAPLPGG